MEKSVVIIGAGPAGLTAAYLLSKAKLPVTVLEADPEYVGGISRTVHYKGFYFDIGGHRFFSKSPEVNNLWNEILPDDFIDRPRKSRIYFGGKFYPYPLDLFVTLRNLGIFQSGLSVLSYLKVRVFPRRPVKSFEDWVVNHFGQRLFAIFFKTYTEKVWGMKCTEISADWAEQRIKGLSLSKAVMHALLPKKRGNVASSKVVKTLINSFRYPRKGPGMMWEKAREKTIAQGGSVLMGARVVSLGKTDTGWRVTYENTAGQHHLNADHVISTMPLREAILAISPSLPEYVLHAANSLKYRDFLVVALVVKERNIFDDNWIYVHEPDVRVGRIQNFKSWSPEMVPDQSLNCYGMEYFCFAGDGLWNSGDAALVELASRELVALKLARAEDIIEGTVVRQPKAYPIYDDAYQAHVQVIRDYLAESCQGLHVVGRAGMHKYNNQDHAMMTAMLTVQNILSGSRYDVWQVNQDAEYHEQASMRGDSGERMVPRKREA